MTLRRRKFMQLAAAVASAPILPRAASALDYPTRPVKIVAGFAAGGGVDITARLIGQWLTDHVAGIIRVPMFILLHPSVPAKTVPDFIAYARKNPGTVNMASAGNGSAPHMAGELFKMMVGVDLVHVPYRGRLAL
jgi:tripartite-type tricarboxylate transporter receptor subunit TctC